MWRCCRSLLGLRLGVANGQLAFQRTGPRPHGCLHEAPPLLPTPPSRTPPHALLLHLSPLTWSRRAWWVGGRGGQEGKERGPRQADQKQPPSLACFHALVPPGAPPLFPTCNSPTHTSTHRQGSSRQAYSPHHNGKFPLGCVDVPLSPGLTASFLSSSPGFALNPHPTPCPPAPTHPPTHPPPLSPTVLRIDPRVPSRGCHAQERPPLRLLPRRPRW